VIVHTESSPVDFSSSSPGRFHVQIDSVGEENWNALIAQFSDATIYQTWGYGAVRRGRENLSHLLLNCGDEVVGCCQVTFRRAGLGLQIAYVVWGPLWQKRGTDADPAIFQRIIQELKREYAIRRGCLLRVSPNVVGTTKTLGEEALAEEGFQVAAEVSPYRTLRLDLSPPLEDLRKNLLQKWRNCLNKAERNDLTVTESTDAKSFGVFLALSEEMLRRKQFTPGVNYEEYANIQQALPEELKMRVLVCENNGEPHCATIFSAIGDTGIYLLGATGEKGLGPNGPYLLQWRMIQSLKERGVRWFDLGGIDPAGNPGVYDFKLGIAGKSGSVEETFIGEYHGCFTWKTQAARFAMRAGNKLKSIRANHS
jgi:lipid II:glycine glycyltransferase (peptidoglycan interpeptide bridge formation enzyme)